MAISQGPKRFGFVLFTFVLLFSGFASLSQPAVAQGDPAYYCDFRNQPDQGDVADWWATDGVAPDCIVLSVDNSVCGVLDASFSSYETLQDGSKPGHLTWYEYEYYADGTKRYSDDFPVYFDEDYKGGSVDILVNFNISETDISVGLSPSTDIDHLRGPAGGGGVWYTVNTDCEGPATEVQWCSPGFWKNHTEAWPEWVDPNALFVDEIGYPAVDKKGNPVDGATLWEVISTPQKYGGWQTEIVASYLSGQYEGFSGTVPDGSLPVVCPL